MRDMYVCMYVRIMYVLCLYIGTVQVLLGAVNTTRFIQMTESARGIDALVRMEAHLTTGVVGTRRRRRGGRGIGVGGRKTTLTATHIAGRAPLEDALHTGDGRPPLQGGTRLVDGPLPLSGDVPTRAPHH